MCGIDIIINILPFIQSPLQLNLILQYLQKLQLTPEQSELVSFYKLHYSSLSSSSISTFPIKNKNKSSNTNTPSSTPSKQQRSPSKSPAPQQIYPITLFQYEKKSYMIRINSNFEIIPQHDGNKCQFSISPSIIII